MKWEPSRMGITVITSSVPFALHRLRHATSNRPLGSPDAHLVYHLPRPARDGRTALRLAALELLDRLARLIPPPRLHRHRYHGVFAPNPAWRKQVVRYGRDDARGHGCLRPRACKRDRPGPARPDRGESELDVATVIRYDNP
jgi:hypothetical protein